MVEVSSSLLATTGAMDVVADWLMSFPVVSCYATGG
jgi:hypothetical protein